MAIEILDKGACKAAGFLDTNAAANTRVQGCFNVNQEATGSMVLGLSEAIGVNEFLGVATASAVDRNATIEWVDDTHVRVRTADMAGVLAAGTCWFMCFRIEGGLPTIVES